VIMLKEISSMCDSVRVGLRASFASSERSMAET
jgi:hypothetical protein